MAVNRLRLPRTNNRDGTACLKCTRDVYSGALLMKVPCVSCGSGYGDPSPDFSGFPSGERQGEAAARFAERLIGRPHFGDRTLEGSRAVGDDLAA